MQCRPSRTGVRVVGALVMIVLAPASAIPRGAAGARCIIGTVTGTDTLTVQAKASSEVPLQGTYRFTVDKNSGSGTSRNAQSGDFSLVPLQDTILSAVTLDRSSIGHYAAELTLEWSQGRASCHSP